MHPAFNQSLANQHRQDIQHEVEKARLTAHLTRKEFEERAAHTTLLARLLGRTTFLARQPVVQTRMELEEVPLTEIKPALQATFLVMRKGGLVSDFDDTFIQQFSETFERELVHQVHIHQAV